MINSGIYNYEYARFSEKYLIQTTILVHIIANERSEQSSYYQSYMGRLDDIQTSLNSIKQI